MGDFTRSLGTTSTNVQFTGSGGFSALGGKRLVNLGGASNLVTWGSGSFVPVGSSLTFNSAFADSEIEFRNPINLNARTNTIQVNDNPAFTTDFATLAGSVTNGALVKTGPGLLVLAGATNRFRGAGLIVSNGTLVVNGATTSSVLNVFGGAATINAALAGPVNVVAGGTLGGTGSVGAVTLQSNAVLSVTILDTLGNSAGLTVAGLLDVANVTLQVINTNLLAAGQTYRAVACGSHTNAFAGSNLPEGWTIDYRYADQIVLRPRGPAGTAVVFR